MKSQVRQLLCFVVYLFDRTDQRNFFDHLVNNKIWNKNKEQRPHRFVSRVKYNERHLTRGEKNGQSFRASKVAPLSSGRLVYRRFITQEESSYQQLGNFGSIDRLKRQRRKWSQQSVLLAAMAVPR